ncbi:OLC1v1034657C1 [Oldenlandia corymbosa var. corymbosa]|uniref:OLC1v1034657C1 n=1 Tax=Oldenlandia corymbosa var. corymbosa TaxID=529605 RepID=A0AAV1CSD2_OLDCO|nr:OLC1v1034657C1 [Oldenlandia corymbosa var. corymbosa]
MDQKKEMSFIVDLNLAGEEEAVDPTGEINLPLAGDLNGNVDIPVEESGLPVRQRAGMDVDSHALLPKKRPKENQVEKEGDFYVSDLVWGKVRSHPWWPGQIIEPSAASERAMKHLKKDSYLIAYFGDQTFAWNEASKLKPFRMYFSEMKEQSNVDTFCDALDGALNEVSRRIEFGLACQCLPEDVLSKLKFQVLVNAGIQDEPTRLYGGDNFSTARSFFPEKLMNYLKALAESPRSNYSVLELVTARAQLLALNRFKGYNQLPMLEEVKGVSENDADLQVSPRDENFDNLGSWGDNPAANGKRKLPSCGNELQQKKKRQKLSLMSGSHSGDPNSESKFQWEGGSKETNLDSKKRKVVGSVSSEHRGKSGRRGSQKAVVDHDGKVVNASNSGASTLTSENLYTGKIYLEECPPMSEILLKLCVAAASPLENYLSLTSIAGVLGEFRNSISLETDTFKEETVSSREIEKKLSKATGTCPPVSKILLKLFVAAANPLEGYRSLTSIAGVLGNFRNSICLENNESKDVPMSLSKTEEKLSKGSEATEYVGTEDSYWTDRIIQNNSNKLVPFGPETIGKKVIPVSEGNTNVIVDDEQEVDAEDSSLPANGNSEDYSPTTLILNFSDLESIPSVPNLNLIFHRFGPLEESRTTILTKSKRAKLIFKRRSDAECAFSRAGKFSIFGPALVSYRLKYEPSLSSSTELTKSSKKVRRRQRKSSEKQPYKEKKF